MSKGRYLWAAIALLPATAWAQDPLAPVPASAEPLVAVPAPAPVIQVPRDWQGVFAAIRQQRWKEAEAGIALLPQDPVTPVAKAELYLAKGSPVVPAERVVALLAEAPDLPHADQLARLAASRGALSTPAVHPRRPTVWLGNAPGRSRARPVSGDLAADQLRAVLDPLVDGNLPVEAEQALMAALPMLTPEARAEAGQRVARIYYSVGQDQDARRVADTYRAGIAGDWAVQSAWISGLASWRLGDCNAAAAAFRDVAGGTRERELRAGALYWAARSEQACRRPHAVAPLLKAAAESQESFYGLVARETLGLATALPAEDDPSPAVAALPNVVRANALVAIGQHALAEEMLRHQARIGHPGQHRGLIATAQRLDLAGAQFWLAHNGQQGAGVSARQRYPAPRWYPARGWRIDPALALAHIRQESSFRIDAVSPVGAVGLMQVMPGTASDMARLSGLPYSPASLASPDLNMEFGQSFIERIRGSSATRDQLPKVIAAYNAGPLPVGRWAALDRGDPLLWMESIPYWETRHYVPSVLRNFWVYQGMMGTPQTTLTDLAQHRWPGFPIAGSMAMRNEPTTP